MSRVRFLIALHGLSLATSVGCGVTDALDPRTRQHGPKSTGDLDAAQLADTDLVAGWFASSPSHGHLTGRASGTAAWVTSGTRGEPSTEKFLTFGPYTTALGAGSYTARFTLMIDNNTFDDAAIADLDIDDASRNFVVLARRSLSRRQFPAAQSNVTFDLPFTTEGGGRLEFRVFFHYGAQLTHVQTQVFRRPANEREPASTLLRVKRYGTFYDYAITYPVYGVMRQANHWTPMATWSLPTTHDENMSVPNTCGPTATNPINELTPQSRYYGGTRVACPAAGNRIVTLPMFSSHEPNNDFRIFLNPGPRLIPIQRCWAEYKAPATQTVMFVVPVAAAKLRTGYLGSIDYCQKSGAVQIEGDAEHPIGYLYATQDAKHPVAVVACERRAKAAPGWPLEAGNVGYTGGPPQIETAMTPRYHALSTAAGGANGCGGDITVGPIGYTTP